MSFQHMQGTALVLGGTGSVGAQICLKLAERGSNVALTYQSNKEAAVRLVSDIKEHAEDAAAYQLDATNTQRSRSLIEAVYQRFSGIHTVIFAGGPFVPQQYISETTPEEFRDHVEQEVVAFFNVMHPAINYLRESQGAIVAVTTTANRRFPVRDALSSGPKAGIESLIRGLAVEEGRYGVRANVVGPGLLADGMAARLMEEGSFSESAQAATMKTIPLRRFGRAHEVAEVALFLASPSSSYVTGQIIDVDGGYQL